MSTTTQATTLRTLQHDDLKELATACGTPCVSILMPTHRTGREVQQAAIRFKNLLREASEQLTAEGHDCSILGPAESLATNSDFWQHQADGLAIFLSPDQCRMLKVDRQLEEQVAVGDSFLLAPLVSEHNATNTCFMLALSWDEARLFRFDGETLESVETKLLPAKFHDLVLPRDPEESLQNTSHRSVGNTPGSSTAMYHGQGEGEDKVQADRKHYLSRVGEEVAGAVYNTNLPLVLFATTEVAGHFVAATDVCVDCKVDGSPAKSSDAQLTKQVRSALAERQPPTAAKFVERFGTAMSKAQASSDLSELQTAAQNGRIESLMVGSGQTDEDAVNAIVLETLKHGGEVFGCQAEELPDGTEVAGIFRF